MILRFTTSILFILTHLTSFSQLQQTERFELEVKRSDEGFSIIAADTLGLILLQESKDYEGKDEKWKVIHLDVNLEIEREDELLINQRYQWIGYEHYGQYLYLLFKQNEWSKSDLHVIKMHIPSGIVNSYDIRNELDFQITHFSVCDDAALMGGYVKQRPTLILYNFEDEKIKAIPNYYLKDAKFIDITVNVNSTFNVLISNEQNAKQRLLELKVFDDKGNQLAYDIYKVPEGKSIITGLTSRLKNENLVVSGIFGANNSNMAEGWFWVKADLSKEQTLNLLPLAKLQSLYDFYPERRRKKMKEKAERKLEDNPFFEKEHIYMHRLLEGDGIYYMLLEFFDPNTVRTSQIPSPYSVGRRVDPLFYSRYYSRIPVQYNSEEYVNIEYEQAIALAMTSNGEILWDHALVMDDKETSVLEQIADFTWKEGKIAMAYKEEDELTWSYINHERNQVTDSTVSISLRDSYDELKNELDYEGGVRTWHDGSMYIWGYQSINRILKDGGKEKIYVFYINKLEMVN